MNSSRRIGISVPLAAALALGLGAFAPSASAYIPGDGKGKPEADCLVGLEGYTSDDQSPFGKKGKPAIQCTDCDPSCDLDGVAEPNGSCTFSIAVRVNDAGEAACTPAALKKVKASAKTKGTKINFSTSFQPPLDGSSATSAFVNFPVLVKKPTSNNPKPGTGKVRVMAKKADKPKLKDKDVFTFACNPLPAGQTCPTVTTTTIVTTTTTTTLPCEPRGSEDPELVLFTNSAPTETCSGATFDPDLQEGAWTEGTEPFSGQIFDGEDNVLGNLGESCLYLGGGAAFNVPPGGNPDNGTQTYAVEEVCPDGTLILGPDEGTSHKDCTLAPASTSSCINILPATTACTTNTDCTADPNSGACAFDANCFFGAPLAIANGGLSTCVINAIAAPAGGTVNTLTGEAEFVMPLQSRVYLTANGSQPCPTCVDDVCDPAWRAGPSPSPNAGQACTAEATTGVTHDCLPAGSFVGAIAVDLTPLTTGTTTMEEPEGAFCEGQLPLGHPDIGTPGTGLNGAFGLLDVRKIVEVGSPAGDLTAGSGQARLASTFCIPATGNGLIDNSANLPGPGATSLPGTLQVVGN